MNPEQIPVSTNPLPAPVAPTVHHSNKLIVFTLVLTSILLIISILPLPYYDNTPVTCKMGQIDCPPIGGWRFTKPTLLTLYDGFFARDLVDVKAPPAKDTLPPEPSPTPTADPTADWNTYVNENVGVSLRYPSTSNGSALKVFASEANKLSFSISIPIAPEPEQYLDVALLKDTSIEDWYKKAYGEAQQGQVTPPALMIGPAVGGLPSKQSTFNLEVIGKSTVIFVQNGNDILQVVMPPTNNHIQLQILSTFKLITDPTANWQIHTDPNLGYSIRYPSTWRSASLGENGIGFGPKEIGEDVLWGIDVFDKATISVNKVIDELGKQFPDRKQTKNNISINGVSASQVITTTVTIPNWYLETIIFETGGNIITISNGAIKDEDLSKMPGVPENTLFKDFYSTFRSNL